MATQTGGNFSILVVCTGNICRSPAVERLLHAAMGVDDGVSISSAGTRAVVGAPINAPMAALVERAGGDSSGFAARELTEAMVREADLVLALTRSHRAAAVTMWPGAVQRSFTLLEFARASEEVDTAALFDRLGPGAALRERLSALVPMAATRRSPVAPEQDDIEDPYGRETEVYERVFDQIASAARSVARAVAV